MKTFILFALLISTPIVASATSHCEEFSLPIKRIHCPSKTIKIEGVIGKREVAYSVPRGTPPRGGFPVAIVFQGSFFKVSFSRPKMMPFGAYNEINLIQKLLDNGFAVLAPRALAKIAWQTNIIGLNYDWSDDKFFINRLLDSVEDGEFGELNSDKLFAVGISSGGYMTDRMAQSHFDRSWRALAIASASYATCGGPMCFLPKKIRSDHPPTLFLHGQRDLIVPQGTMEKYAKLLKRNGVQVKKVIDKKAGHKWIKSTGNEVVKFFNANL